MHIVHVVPSVSNEASGPSYSVVALCRALNAGEHSASLTVLDSASETDLPDFVKTFPVAGVPNRLGRSPALRRWLRAAVVTGSVDIVHNHSLWMMPNVYPGWATRGTGVPLVVSPRGTLSRWALSRSKWVKRVFWAGFQSRAIRQAACFHATSGGEYADIRRAGFRQPVCIIPNGIDVPDPLSGPEPNTRSRRLLFVGRIHPKKGLDNLLRAWGSVARRYPDWQLQVVGPDNVGYLGQMQSLARELRLERVEFRGPLYGDEKLRAYQEAELYVLPTHSENFGMTVAEALAAGTPAIVTRGAPWSSLEQHGAGWWIEIGVDPLVACLEEALSTSTETLAAMGRSGRQWMQREYSWERIGRMMMKTYRWLHNGGKVPRWVKR